MIRSALSFLSPGGVNARLCILIFHRVLPMADPLFPDEPDGNRFDQIICWVKSWFNVLPLDAAVSQLLSGNLPARAAVITFDDGYADNRTVALPILKKHGLPATFFIATGFLDGGRMWNDTIIEAVRLTSTPSLNLEKLGLGIHVNGSHVAKREAIKAIIDQIKYLPLEERAALAENIARELRVASPDNLMMTSQQVREMHQAGMQIGAHTINHPILARTGPREAEHEIRTSKEKLENLLDAPVTLFAYPNGKPGQDYLAEHCEIVRGMGFQAAVSTGWGAADITTDVYQLPRFTPWDQSRLRFALRLMRNYHQAPQFTG